MTSSINASLSAGVVTTADTSGILQLQTASTAALTIDASQRVGIGTVGTIPSWGSSPTGVLQVGGSTLSAYSGEIELSLNAYYAGGWKYNANGYASQYLQNTGVHQWFTAANNTSGAGASISDFSSPKMTLNINGALALFGASTSANGVGITFPATQSASSDANTLDDYEEGTWTPSVGGNATYSGQEGRYTKIGNLVMISCQLGISLIGTGSTTTISGLPFSSARSWFGGGCTYETALATSVVELRPSIQGASSDIIFLGRTAASTGTTSAITVFQNNTAIYFSGTYLVV